MINVYRTLLFAGALLVGCASLSPVEITEKQRALDEMADQAIAKLLQKQPELKTLFAEALGYMVLDAKTTKIPFIGGGSGTGVVVNNATQQRTYVKATRFEIGGGLGVRVFKAIAVFTNEQVLANVQKGGWTLKSGAEAAAGGAATEGSITTKRNGYQYFVLSESGASATITIRVLRLQPYF